MSIYYEPKVEVVHELRNKTGFGMMECKKALQEAKGDMGRAIEIVEKYGNPTILIHRSRGDCGCGNTKYKTDHRPWDHAGWQPD